MGCLEIGFTCFICHISFTYIDELYLVLMCIIYFNISRRQVYNGTLVDMNRSFPEFIFLSFCSGVKVSRR